MGDKIRKSIGKSSEDYLESILMLRQKLEKVRSIDIVNELNFSKPSVSIAMRKLKDMGHITIDDNSIHLTDSGEIIAKKIYARHKLLERFLIDIGVDETTAFNEACEIEHCISNDTFEKLAVIVDKIENNEKCG